MINKPRKLKKLANEIWREVPNCDGRYFVSNYGRVKSYAYKKEDGQILKNYEVNGFKTVHLRLIDKKQTYYLHKLVAEIWVPKPADDYQFVAHKDGNVKNNHESNLIWMTRKMLHDHHRKLRKEIGFGKPKSQINNSKLKVEDVKLLKSMLQRGTPQYQIAKMFCISEMQVTRIKRGENWAHVQVDA